MTASASAAAAAAAGAADDDDVSGAYDFAFDNLVLPEERTDVLYRTSVYPVVRAAMEGYNGTVFAYGQTGSGKTYTMTGTPDEPGVIPCAIADVFAMIREDPSREFLLRVSYLEIYNETLRDLLAGPADAANAAGAARLSPRSPRSAARGPRIVEEKGRISIANLHEEIVTTPDAVLAVLERGEAARHIGATDWNTRSSRSHCVFQITIESRDDTGEVRVSRLNLIDLAGSERAASEAARRKEGAFINKSLLTLGTVIAKLTEPGGSDHIPYRDSKLTRLLQTSLSGDARVAVVCTLSMSPEHALESLSTLKFGRRCKLVVTSARRQTSVDDKALLEHYKREIDMLRARLESSEAAGRSLPQTPTMPLSSDDLEALSRQRAAAEQEVAEMHETRRNLKNQIDHLTRLILTSRSVAENTPQRRALPPPNNAPSSPAVRRGPRMSDVPARALRANSGDYSESDMLNTLRRELAEARERQERDREAHTSKIQELEAALQMNQAELVRLREEHACEEAHREFKELVAQKTGESPNSDSVNDMALHARIAALERALAEERAMRDLAQLPGRPAASPMQARHGNAPLAPPRSRSQSGSPSPEEMQRLQSRIEAQESLIRRLQSSVEAWRERMRGQSHRVRELLALYEETAEKPTRALPEPGAQHRSPHVASRPLPQSPVRQSRALPEPTPMPMRQAVSPANVPLPPSPATRPGTLPSPSPAPGPSQGPGKRGSVTLLHRPSPVLATRSPRLAATSPSLTASPSMDSSSSQSISARPPSERGPRAPKRTFVPAEQNAAAASAQTQTQTHPQPRRLPKETLLMPFGAPADTKPALAAAAPPRAPSGDSKARSLAAEYQRRVSDRRRVSSSVRSRSPHLETASISARAHALESAAASSAPAPPRESHPTTSRLPPSATIAFRMPSEAPSQRDSAGVKMPPSQSQVVDRKARDSILRELNDLKSMPRVKSSRTMYMPHEMTSRPSLMPATGYRTDASAYYI
ncbi:hypothetical protein MCUN1_001510 [Malassezia cuniculi]|uniref:Kinesin-like protein n=1 Tax=Malassezia cuniculi TaxID=948313 RepID=A0AAF0EU81_9BASI|nr:hypothetical protein MCUN1_001510 [Malassezia cuniculi]